MKIVAVISGGMDSVTLTHQLVDEGYDVVALSVDYGQRHRRELDFAYQTGQRLGIPWTCADLFALTPLLGGSALTDPMIPVPDGHYAEESMRTTVVPNRNMILLAVAGGYAVAQHADTIALAVHAGDHFIYPDCRPEFLDAFATTLNLATDGFGNVGLLTPYTHHTKADIVTIGDRLGVPWLATWSCYKGGLRHCGTCGTCVERREAFAIAGVIDPTDYADLVDA